MSYREALKRLEAYEPKKLIARRYYSELAKCACAIGAVIPETRDENGTRIAPLIRGNHKIELAVHDSGMTVEEASLLQNHNDGILGPSPEARYELALAWLRERVAEEGQTP